MQRMLQKVWHARGPAAPRRTFASPPSRGTNTLAPTLGTQPSDCCALTAAVSCRSRRSGQGVQGSHAGTAVSSRAACAHGRAFAWTACSCAVASAAARAAASAARRRAATSRRRASAWLTARATASASASAARASPSATRRLTPGGGRGHACTRISFFFAKNSAHTPPHHHGVPLAGLPKRPGRLSQRTARCAPHTATPRR